MTTIDKVISRLKDCSDTWPDGAALIGCGGDPIFLTTQRLGCGDLDQISTDRPIAIKYSDFHLLCANAVAIEMAAMFPVMRRLGTGFGALSQTKTAIQKAPRDGHRHVLQHCQMMSADQYRRCAETGICTNIFSNHTWYFADQHAARTLGRKRANRMNAARTALDAGVHIALHSDAPVTPMGTVWGGVVHLL